MASLRALQLLPNPEPDFLALRYRADLHMLVARWQRPVSPAELRLGYAAVLAAAADASCGCWLVDLRRRTAPALAETHWLMNEFLPRVPTQLGTALYLGLLLPPHFAVPLAPPHSVLPPAADGVPPEPVVRSFSDEGEIMHWLACCQPPGR